MLSFWHIGELQQQYVNMRNYYCGHYKIVFSQFTAMRIITKCQIEHKGPAFPVFEACRIIDFVLKQQFLDVKI